MFLVSTLALPLNCFPSTVWLGTAYNRLINLCSFTSPEVGTFVFSISLDPASGLLRLANSTLIPKLVSTVIGFDGQRTVFFFGSGPRNTSVYRLDVVTLASTLYPVELGGNFSVENYVLCGGGRFVVAGLKNEATKARSLIRIDLLTGDNVTAPVPSSINAAPYVQLLNDSAGFFILQSSKQPSVYIQTWDLVGWNPIATLAMPSKFTISGEGVGTAVSGDLLFVAGFGPGPGIDPILLQLPLVDGVPQLQNVSSADGWSAITVTAPYLLYVGDSEEDLHRWTFD